MRRGRSRVILVSEVVSPPYTNSVCVLEWKCPVSRAKGVFLLPPCVCPPLITTTTGDPPSWAIDISSYIDTRTSFGSAVW